MQYLPIYNQATSAVSNMTKKSKYESLKILKVSHFIVEPKLELNEA